MPQAPRITPSWTHTTSARWTELDKVFATCSERGQKCTLRHPQFGYVKPSEAKHYFELAKQYTFADRMFQTNQGPSFHDHEFIISGTSAPSAISPCWRRKIPSDRAAPPMTVGSGGPDSRPPAASQSISSTPPVTSQENSSPVSSIAH